MYSERLTALKTLPVLIDMLTVNLDGKILKNGALNVCKSTPKGDES